jgi:hypothetical protein
MGLLTVIAAAEEGSKTAFYIAGIVLVIFALLISALGFTRPQFPGSDNGARGVIGLGAVLVLLTMAMIIAVSS